MLDNLKIWKKQMLPISIFWKQERGILQVLEKGRPKNRALEGTEANGMRSPEGTGTGNILETETHGMGKEEGIGHMLIIVQAEWVAHEDFYLLHFCMC